MTMSYNKEPGGIMYAPARDFAHNYPVMVKCVRDAFTEKYWPVLMRVLGSAYYSCGGLDPWNSVCDANDAFAQFLNICCQDSEENFKDVCKRSGWDRVPAIGQVGWLAMLGTVMMGQLFQGLRDITREGTDAPSCMETLLRSGHNARCVVNNLDRDIERANDLLELRALGRKLRDAGMSVSDLCEAFEEGVRV